MPIEFSLPSSSPVSAFSAPKPVRFTGVPSCGGEPAGARPIVFAVAPRTSGVSSSTTATSSGTAWVALGLST